MVATSNTTTHASLFKNSAPDSVYGKINRKNLDDDSFVGLENTMNTILSNPKTASFQSVSDVIFTQEYRKCKVISYCNTNIGKQSI